MARVLRGAVASVLLEAPGGLVDLPASGLLDPDDHAQIFELLDGMLDIVVHAIAESGLGVVLTLKGVAQNRNDKYFNKVIKMQTNILMGLVLYSSILRQKKKKVQILFRNINQRNLFFFLFEPRRA